MTSQEVVLSPPSLFSNVRCWETLTHKIYRYIYIFVAKLCFQWYIYWKHLSDCNTQPCSSRSCVPWCPAYENPIDNNLMILWPFGGKNGDNLDFILKDFSLVCPSSDIKFLILLLFIIITLYKQLCVAPWFSGKLANELLAKTVTSKKQKSYQLSLKEK